MLFIDSDQPIKTCVSENCDGCAVHKSLHCHFKPTDLIISFISIPAFSLGRCRGVSRKWLAVFCCGYA